MAVEHAGTVKLSCIMSKSTTMKIQKISKCVSVRFDATQGQAFFACAALDLYD